MTMITKMTGTLTRVLDEDVRLAVGPFEYQLLVPESVRRQVQLRIGQEVTFHTTEYLEGNQAGSRFVPRAIGFLHEAELEFFELFCTVEKIGVKKALKALSRPVKEIADAVQRQDVKWLTTLPGIGAATAEQIVASLKRKVTKFALMTTPRPAADANGQPAAAAEGGDGTPATVVDGAVLEDVYQALMSVGHSPIEARAKLDQLLTGGKTFRTVEQALSLIYGRG
jgi:Holliday junction DNA helicase RuvA